MNGAGKGTASPDAAAYGDAATEGSDPICVISSMATAALLTELVSTYQSQSARPILVESVGGVVAARRVAAGEAFDLVVLARDAIDRLSAAGHLVATSVVDLVCSAVAVAIPAGSPRPEIGSADALKRAVLAARTIAYSTGPSGVQVARLFERWGIVDQLRERIVIPPPGVPVGSLIARGEVALGFQQHSELLDLDGVEVLGPLPAAIQIVTTFSGAVGGRARNPDAAATALAFMGSPAAADAKRRQGMDLPDGCRPGGASP